MTDRDRSLLEPEDWDAYRRAAHDALDMALDFARDRQQDPVWQELPDELKRLDDPLPAQPAPLPDVVGEVQTRILPHTLGNTHPRFWGWVHGSGTAGGIVSQLLIGALNANPVHATTRREDYSFPNPDGSCSDHTSLLNGRA